MILAGSRLSLQAVGLSIDKDEADIHHAAFRMLLQIEIDFQRSSFQNVITSLFEVNSAHAISHLAMSSS